MLRKGNKATREFSEDIFCKVLWVNVYPIKIYSWPAESRNFSGKRIEDGYDTETKFELPHLHTISCIPSRSYDPTITRKQIRKKLNVEVL